MTQQTPGLLPAAGQWYNQPTPGFYPGQTTAGFNPIQRTGWNFGMQGYQDAYRAAQGLQAPMARAGQTYMDAVRSPAPGGITADPNAGAVGSQYLNMLTPEEINQIEGNFEVDPYISDQVDFFRDQLTRGFQEALPTTSIAASLAGQAGGSRHGVAQGRMYDTMAQQMRGGIADMTGRAWSDAAQRALQSRGQTLQAYAQDRARGTQAGLQDARTRADIAMGNARNTLGGYQSRMGALSNMPSMMSAYAQARMLPSQTMLQGSNWLTGIGNQHQNLAQTQINNEMSRWNYLVNAGPQKLADYAKILSGSGLGQFGTDQQVVNAPNQFAQLLGGIGGIASGIGAGLGPAGLGLFGSTIT